MVAATRKFNSVQSQTCCSDEIDVCNRDENSACVKILYLKNLVQNQLKFYFYEIWMYRNNFSEKNKNRAKLRVFLLAPKLKCATTWQLKGYA